MSFTNKILFIVLSLIGPAGIAYFRIDFGSPDLPAWKFTIVPMLIWIFGTIILYLKLEEVKRSKWQIVYIVLGIFLIDFLAFGVLLLEFVGILSFLFIGG